MSKSASLKHLFTRDLGRLRSEIQHYANEESLWVTQEGINNSAGNLALHICGNLRHFIGAVLGRSSYVRDRTFEFEGRTSRGGLLAQIDEAMNDVNSFFGQFAEEDLDGFYPVEVFGESMTVFFFLVHLQGHLNYHLGQINYHRRLLAE